MTNEESVAVDSSALSNRRGANNGASDSVMGSSLAEVEASAGALKEANDKDGTRDDDRGDAACDDDVDNSGGGDKDPGVRSLVEECASGRGDRDTGSTGLSD